MRYDPTLKALFFPERDAPVEDFSTEWPLDPVCAELCRLAYVRFEKKDRPKLEGALAKAGFVGEPACFHRRRTGAEGFGTVAPDGTAFVAFRGTQITSLRDIFADVAAPPVRWAGEGRVHWGFWNSYRSIREEIDAWVASAGGKRLVVTGHSLGAAMATLMAALHDRAELVTFGSPRVGNRAFADRFAGRAVRRYVDCVDGIPRLPPPLGYAHAGEMSYIDRLGQVHGPPPDKAALRQDRRKARWAYRRKHAWRPGNVPARSGADHAPVNYVSALLDGARAVDRDFPGRLFYRFRPMPKLHVEALIFCLAWAALAIAGGLYAGWWVGVLLSLGLLVLISASSLQILSQSEDPTLERQVRWGILIVAALGLAVYLNA